MTIYRPSQEPYNAARNDHVVYLREQEKLTFEAIGQRLGICKNQAWLKYRDMLRESREKIKAP